MAGEFVANGTWNCPTLIRVRAQQLCDSPDFATDPDLRYLSAKLLHTWTAVAADFTSRFSAEERDTFAAQFEMQLQLVAIFDRVGVPMLAGTDAVGAVWVIPGSSLHREFDLLGRAGLTPLRVLQTATVRPAEFLGLEDVSGTVATGRRADLVLLDADPLQDVSHLHTVTGVVRAGTVYSTTDLAKIKDETAAYGLR